MAGRKSNFTIRQLAMSVGYCALAFSLARLVGLRVDQFHELLMLGGYCAALGAAVGVLQNRAIRGSALGFASFLAACVLMALLGG
jgi:hypothetical protein